MFTLIVSVLIASLLGSLHCAGMCGAFVVIAVGIDRDDGGDARRRASPGVLHAAYHGGRLVTYTLLGVAAGGVGHALDLGGSAVGLQRVAALLAAATMIVAGGIALARALGLKLPRVVFPAFFQSMFMKGHALTIGLNPTGRALAIGLLTTLLPCGWLWAFAVVAAGTGHPLYGGLAMAAFWLGTLPMLVSIGVGFRSLSGAMGRYVPGVMAGVIVVVGVLTLFGRVSSESMIRGGSEVYGSGLPGSGGVTVPASRPTLHLPLFHGESCGDSNRSGS